MTSRIIPLLLVCAAFAASADEAAPETRIYVGAGLGYEAGNGIRLGYSRGANGIETGFGLTYSGIRDETSYSVGARYLRTLYEGAYAWIGAGTMGQRSEADRERLVSAGAGLGISWKLGTMFRLKLDSGWRIYSDSEIADGDTQINPTFNGAIVYEW